MPMGRLVLRLRDKNVLLHQIHKKREERHFAHHTTSFYCDRFFRLDAFAESWAGVQIICVSLCGISWHHLGISWLQSQDTMGIRQQAASALQVWMSKARNWDGGPAFASTKTTTCTCTAYTCTSGCNICLHVQLQIDM